MQLGNIPSFDLQAVCSGFLYGIQTADIFITSGKYKTILLVCAEKMSSLLDWKDRNTCILFGDGAGAIILQRADNDASRIIDSKIYSDGTHCDMLYTDGGVSTTGVSGKIKMNGRVLFKHAIDKMSESVLEILASNNLTAEMVDYFIPHQANLRIIDNLAKQLHFDSSKVVKTINKHANCSAASIPLALSSLHSTGALQRGHIILFTTFGAGLTWGSALIQW
jgi:3-oxoacyl-[acyl-carrier-protein] synthase-3